MNSRFIDGWLERLAKLPSKQQYLLIATLIILLGLIDYLSGPELSKSLFYLLPIGLAVWLKGRRLGIYCSIASALILLTADLASNHVFSSALIPLWNMLIRLGVFLVVSFLLSALHQTLLREKAQASIDFLTGAVNTRSFLETLNQEILRARRYQHPFTLAYFDLDNFKQVNDEHGHAKGDEVLRLIVQTLKAHLRAVDTIARLGGDEFSVLLPETSSEAAQTVLAKINGEILSAMRRENLPVTLSAGVITYENDYPDSNEVIKTADKLMYEVKRGSKNAMTFETHSQTQGD
ncbi:MAG: diguanylate cyclase [Trueperaceae bacterium]|nr:diguanylate cyclase [Trueperaceae bacterium]